MDTVMDTDTTTGTSLAVARALDTPSDRDPLWSFEALARWKAFEIRHAHPEMEQPETILASLTRINEAIAAFRLESARIQHFSDALAVAPPQPVSPTNPLGMAIPVPMLPMNDVPGLHIAAMSALHAELEPAFYQLWAGMGMDEKIAMWKTQGFESDLARLTALDMAECRGSQIAWRGKGYVARMDTGGTNLLRHNLPFDSRPLNPINPLSTVLNPWDRFSDMVGLSLDNTPEAATRRLRSAVNIHTAGYTPGLGNPFSTDATSLKTTFIDRLDAAVKLGSGPLALQAFGFEAFSSNRGLLALPGYLHADRGNFRQKISSIFLPQNEIMLAAMDATPAHALEEVRLWLEHVGALSFCQKYWGASWSSAYFADIETAIAHRVDLETAFDGNQSLGRTSVFLGGRLGILPQGNLPQRCFERLSELGLTRSGWKLLAQLDDPLKRLSSYFEPCTLRALTYITPVSSKIELPYATPTPTSAGVSYEVNDTRINDLLSFNDSSTPSTPGGPDPSAAQDIQMVRSLCAAASGAALANTGSQNFNDHLVLIRDLVLARSDARIPAQARGADYKEFDAALPAIAAGFFMHLTHAPDAALRRFIRIEDFTRDAEAGSFAAFEGLGPKQAWAKLGSMESAWHEMIQRRQRGERETIAWSPLSTEWPSDRARGLTFVELADGGALYDEGKALHHCVSSYAEMCQAGQRRILSLSVNGTRTATLELISKGPGWTMGQFNASHNAPVRDEACLGLAAAALNTACMAQAALNAKTASALPSTLVKLASRREHDVPATAPVPQALG